MPKSSVRTWMSAPLALLLALAGSALLIVDAWPTTVLGGVLIMVAVLMPLLRLPRRTTKQTASDRPAAADAETWLDLLQALNAVPVEDKPLAKEEYQAATEGKAEHAKGQVIYFETEKQRLRASAS